MRAGAGRERPTLTRAPRPQELAVLSSLVRTANLTFAPAGGGGWGGGGFASPWRHGSQVRRGVRNWDPGQSQSLG